jgi:hypothetical protein
MTCHDANALGFGTETSAAWLARLSERHYGVSCTLPLAKNAMGNAVTPTWFLEERSSDATVEPSRAR